MKLNGGQACRYYYDDMGQLIREDNTPLGKTYVYTYDDAGNLLSKKIYTLNSQGGTPTGLISTYNYGYTDANWGDKLTSYRGHAITYDGVGNPLSYYNGKDYSFTWSGGRRLATASVGSYQLSFEYNDEGIRTSKTVGSVKHTYYLNGSQIMAETWGETLLVYLYDAEGNPIGMQYRNIYANADTFETYWFEKNLQGDIIAVYNSSGVKLISYTYDAWGNVTTSYHNGASSYSVADKNPFRYRGYYYDVETGFYYLQSRYYDPAIRRFINADAFISTGQGILGNNMFAYCRNNPVCAQDPTGHRDDWCSGVSKKSIDRIIFDGGMAVGGASVIYIGELISNLIECLTKSLIRSGRTEYKNEYEEHHIVAKKAFNARKAAAILATVFPDGVENQKNKVYLKTSVHRRVHTYGYYVLVNSAIISAYENAQGNPEQQSKNVIHVLDALRSFLEALNVLSTN